MPDIFIKRIYLPADAGDGMRILVDRLWPRGVSKTAAALDWWAKDLAPTPALRKWFDHDPARFQQFQQDYLAELKGSAVVAEALERIGKARATLLYAAHDPHVNHAIVLADYLSALE